MTSAMTSINIHSNSNSLYSTINSIISVGQQENTAVVYYY